MPSAELLTSIAAPPSPSSPRLPLELLAQIIQEAIATYFADSHWSSGAACCLLSKSLLPFAQEALYHTVPLRGLPEESSDTTHPNRSGYGQLYHPIPRNLQLIDTLEAHPRLAASVKEICLRVGGPYIPVTAQRNHLSSLIRSCHGVKAVDDRASGWIHQREIAEALSKAPSAGPLNSLRVNTLQLEASSPLPSSFSSLKHLEMDALEVWDSEQLLSLPAWQLHSFAIRCFDTNPMNRLLDNFLSDSHHTLRRLEIAPDLLNLGPVPDLSAFVALEDLTIRMCPDPDEEEEERSDEERAADVKRALEYALSLMATCAALTRFELSSPIHLFGAELVVQQVQATEFFQRLPASLTTLDVRSLPLLLTALLTYLADDDVSSLQRLDTKRFEMKEERRALKGACWSRGVELYSHAVEYERVYEGF